MDNRLSFIAGGLLAVAVVLGLFVIFQPSDGNSAESSDVTIQADLHPTTTVAAPSVAPDPSIEVAGEVACAAGERLVAAGAGERFDVTLCAALDGTLTYRGVRLRDRASIELSACAVDVGLYRADNEGSRYEVKLGANAGSVTVTDPEGSVIAEDDLTSLLDPQAAAVTIC